MNSIEETKAFSFGLPKWPQMLVTGKPITIEQAKDIIFATDTFLTCPSEYSGGNDRLWVTRFRERCGYDQLDSHWELYTALQERANFLNIAYVHNSWASTAFIHGPHGWCHPNGTIKYVDNVGKWPSVEEIAVEWKKIASRWPFLEVWITLMDGEECENGTSPVVTFYISNGTISYFQGTDTPHLEKFPQGGIIIPSRDMNDAIAHVMHINRYDYSHERGLPKDWIDEFISRIRPIVDTILTKKLE